MRYGMYTLNRHELENFKDSLPEYVFSNCGKNGIFVLGATDEDRKIIGVAQFFVRMLPGNDPIADIVYVYVAEEYRGNGLASRMINEIHKLMKKSGGEKCLALLKKKQKEQHLFERNGYLFMKSKDDMIGYLEDVHENLGSGHLEQGVYYINR